ncbi:hypothetical protein F2Q70_00017215 [Brassica cretica]|uniref:Uncharacterized protein n=1 Tax=Brassica cretica TaxID=69181 RepID=A0A8S9HW77_BRACR|nr:hypothetical protein F2Q70_00017215 [Brassica cretica]
MRGDTRCTHLMRHVSDTCRRTPLTSRWLAAWLECMRRDTQLPTCRSACICYMRGDTSFSDMSSCMCCFHVRRHLQLLKTLSWLDGCHHVLIPKIKPPRASRSILPDFGLFGKFLTRDQSRIFFRSGSDETSFYQNIELLNRRASKNVLVEPSQELFTLVDCSQRNSGGIVRDLEVQICNALVPVDFHVLDIKLNWNSSLLLGRAFLSTVGPVCNLQANQLCQTLIDPNAHYDPIPVKKPQMSSRRINDPGIIAACHCGTEYETSKKSEQDLVETTIKA